MKRRRVGEKRAHPGPYLLKRNAKAPVAVREPCGPSPATADTGTEGPSVLHNRLFLTFFGFGSCRCDGSGRELGEKCRRQKARTIPQATTVVSCGESLRGKTRPTRWRFSSLLEHCDGRCTSHKLRRRVFHPPLQKSSSSAPRTRWMGQACGMLEAYGVRVSASSNISPAHALLLSFPPSPAAKKKRKTLSRPHLLTAAANRWR